MTEYNLIFIKWVDVCGDPEHGWKDENSTVEFFERKDNIVKEVGFVFSEDDDYINLIGAYMPSDDIGLTRHRTKIPKKWILKRIELQKFIK
jgi:hypothetical protein